MSIEAEALMCLQRPHEALRVCEGGLLLQPSHLQLREALQAVVRHLGDSKEDDTEHYQKAYEKAYQPMRLHHVLHDPALKDAYTYLAIKSDMHVPWLRMQQLGGSSGFADATCRAVKRVVSRGQAARVLQLGARSGACCLFLQGQQCSKGEVRTTCILCVHRAGGSGSCPCRRRACHCCGTAPLPSSCLLSGCHPQRSGEGPPDGGSCGLLRTGRTSRCAHALQRACGKPHGRWCGVLVPFCPS